MEVVQLTFHKLQLREDTNQPPFHDRSYSAFQVQGKHTSHKMSWLEFHLLRPLWTARSPSATRAPQYQGPRCQV